MTPADLLPKASISNHRVRPVYVDIGLSAVGDPLADGAGLVSRRAFSHRMVTVVNVWSGVTIDCLDPQRVARFWSALLDREPGPSQAGWVYLGKRDDPQPRLIFQPVTQPKTGKVRIHLDVTVDDISEAINVVTSLGGHFTGERHEYDEGASSLWPIPRITSSAWFSTTDAQEGGP